MTRYELEQCCLRAMDAGQRQIRLLLPGSPDTKTAKLLGKQGPKGTVIDWRGSRIIAAFDASRVLAYLDSIPVGEFSAEEEISPEEINPGPTAN